MTTARKLTRIITMASLWRAFRRDLFDTYRPERHYMRGPGPKWRAKHPQDPASGGLADAAV
jgi:hypothetical protein